MNKQETPTTDTEMQKIDSEALKEMTNEELNKIAGGANYLCPPGYIWFNNCCVERK